MGNGSIVNSGEQSASVSKAGNVTASQTQWGKRREGSGKRKSA